MLREQWLNDAVGHLTGHFETSGGRRPPKNVRVTCGWPGSKALSRKGRRIGECWPEEASKGGQFEIFISPFLSDPIEVLETLVHELAHATVGTEAGHGKAFSQFARKLGLEGPPTATHAGEDLREMVLRPITAELGEYPHDVLDRDKSPTKKQGTRMLKLVCEECGYTARTTAKWLESHGALICPCNKKQMLAVPPKSNDDEGDEDA